MYIGYQTSLVMGIGYRTTIMNIRYRTRFVMGIGYRTRRVMNIRYRTRLVRAYRISNDFWGAGILELAVNIGCRTRIDLVRRDLFNDYRVDTNSIVDTISMVDPYVEVIHASNRPSIPASRFTPFRADINTFPDLKDLLYAAGREP